MKGRDEKKMDLVSCLKANLFFVPVSFSLSPTHCHLIIFFFVFEWQMNTKYLGMSWLSVGALKKHAVIALLTGGILFHSIRFNRSDSQIFFLHTVLKFKQTSYTWITQLSLESF